MTNNLNLTDESTLGAESSSDTDETLRLQQKLELHLYSTARAFSEKGELTFKFSERGMKLSGTVITKDGHEHSIG